MAKSSYAAAIFLAGWGAAASAAPPEILPVDFDLATIRTEARLGGPIALGCPGTRGGSDEEIVVCGRTPHRPVPRLPLPIEREPGEIVRHVNDPGGGGAPAADACTRNCYKPVTINLIDAARAMPKIIRHILGRDD
jgi:hypothetical protein